MKRNKLLTLFAAAMMLFGVQNASAFRLTAVRGSNYGQGEGPARLVDGTQDTKWGTWDGYYGNPVYAVFKAEFPIAPTTYELVIAGDTNGSPGRNWKSWKIYGGNFTNEAEAVYDATDWVLIDDKQEQTLTTFPFDVNTLSISNPDGNYYSYFLIEVEALANDWGEYCQMDEFRFKDFTLDPSVPTLTCTAGTNFGTDTGIDKMFDNKFSTMFVGATGDDTYAILTASEPVFVWAYDVTANGGSVLGQRVIYGTNDATVAADPNSTGWIQLSDFNSWIQNKAYNRQRFLINKSAINPYKYYKVALKSGGNVQLSEFSLLYETKRVIAYNWIASSSSGSANAFDGKPDPKWEGGNLANGNNWFTIEAADAKAHPIKGYAFTTHDDGDWGNRAPKEWRLEGSNDNSNWVTIDEVKGSDPIQNTNFKTFEFIPTNTADAFRYYKLTLLSMKGTGWTQIGEFHVLSVADVSDKDYYTTLVNDAKAAAANYEAVLGATDPWYVEYKAIIDQLDGILTTAISTANYIPVQEAIDATKQFTEKMDKFVDGASYVAIAGTACWGDGHWSQLVDGKDGVDGRESTKWGGNFSGNVGDDNHVQYVIFRCKTAFKPYFYRLVTGGDTYSQRTRNWKTWKVYGGNFTNIADAVYDPTKWTVLDSRENISEEYLPMENCYPAAFNFTEFPTTSYPDGVDKEYYYYMVAVTASGGSQQQMNEMYLCTKDEFEAARNPLVAYFDGFDAMALVVESELEAKKTEFVTLFAELQTTSDPVRMTKVYNELVAMRAELEASAAYMELVNNVSVVDGAYQLGTAQDLVRFANALSSKDNLNAALTADIDIQGVDLSPMGSDLKPYKGNFNGQGFAIKNFAYSNPDKNNVGLFGYISGSTIQKVLLSNANVNGNANSAALVGNAQNASTIDQCAVVQSYIEGRDHVAAIVGNAAGGSTISNCLSDADVYSRSYQAGGLVGTVLSGAIVQNNLFTGSVECNGGNASGLVSLIDADDANPTIKNNVIAAKYVKGSNPFSIINTSGRSATFANNLVLETTEYYTGSSIATITRDNKDGSNGLAVSFKDLTHKSVYYGKTSTLMWSIPSIWNFFAAGNFPVLSYMELPIPAAQTISVTSALYATAVAAEELDFSKLTDVTAYVAQLNGASVSLQSISVVPRGEPFIIKVPAAGDYQIPYAVEYGADVNNDLQVSETDFTVNGAYYILASVDGNVSFVRADEGSTIAAGKGFVLIPAQTITVSAAGYATMVAEANLDLTGSDAQAFTAQIQDNYILLTPITLVPKDEVVIVKAAEGTYDFLFTDETIPAVENNVLKASDTDLVADGTQYILANGADGVGFYQASTGSTIAAGKGYIEIAGGSGVKVFFFAGEDATGIKEVQTMANGPVYNLAGQRLSKMQKGVNIMNGKKIAIK